MEDGGSCDGGGGQGVSSEMIWPALPPQYRGVWEGALARLEALHELEAPVADIFAAREYRDDICTEICDYFLTRWDTLSPEEQESMELVMSKLAQSREINRAAFESMQALENNSENS